MSDDDVVGYGKPPKHSQFKKGQSGNPRGREKGSRGLKTDLTRELRAKHTIQVNGKPVTGTRQQLLVRTLAIRAASGDLKAAQLLLPTIIQVLGIEDRGGAKEALSSSDQLLLDELLSDRLEPEPSALGLSEPELSEKELAELEELERQHDELKDIHSEADVDEVLQPGDAL